jgi:SulP family sulfate permease
MTGFLTGIALTIVLGQLGDLTGYPSSAGNKITQTLDLLLHLGQVDGATTLVGLATIGLVLLLNRTRLATYAMALALVIAAIGVALWQPPSVQLIRDISPIPQAFPLPVLPDLSLVPNLLVGAVAIALLGLIQGAGISKTVPNANGRYADVSQDFSAQGIANLTAGLFRGMPVGGSLAGTAFSVSVGAKSRWTGVFTGLSVIAIALLLAKGVERIPQPAIAALLVLAGLQLLLSKLDGARDVWLTGWTPRLIMVATLIATLLLPVQQAVLLGVALSVLAYLYKSSLDVEVKELVLEPGGLGAREQAVPATLPPNAITILNVYGSVFYASADTLQQLLPSTQTAERSAVILSLRGRRDVGSTFLKLLERYALDLTAHHSKLILTGISPGVIDQLEKTGAIDTFIPKADIFPATEVLGGALLQAYTAAQAWLSPSGSTV